MRPSKPTSHLQSKYTRPRWTPRRQARRLLRPGTSASTCRALHLLLDTYSISQIRLSRPSRFLRTSPRVWLPRSTTPEALRQRSAQGRRAGAARRRRGGRRETRVRRLLAYSVSLHIAVRRSHRFCTTTLVLPFSLQFTLVDIALTSESQSTVSQSLSNVRETVELRYGRNGGWQAGEAIQALTVRSTRRRKNDKAVIPTMQCEGAFPTQLSPVARLCAQSSARTSLCRRCVDTGLLLHARKLLQQRLVLLCLRQNGCQRRTDGADTPERTISLLRQCEAVPPQLLPARARIQLVRLLRPVLAAAVEELRASLARLWCRDNLLGRAGSVRRNACESLRLLLQGLALLRVPRSVGQSRHGKATCTHLDPLLLGLLSRKLCLR